MAVAAIPLLMLLAACGGAASVPAVSGPSALQPVMAATPAAIAPSAAGSAASSSAAVQPAVTLKLAEHGLLSNAPLYVAQAKGYFAEQGLQVEFTRMQSGPDMIAPLSANQVDLAVGAPGAGLNNAIASGIPIRIVADKGTDFQGKSFAALVMRKDLIDSGQVKDYPDLKGKKIAVAGKASLNELDVVRGVAKGGLTLNDVQEQILGYPETITALSNKAIDGAIVVEPFVAQAVETGVGGRWRGAEDFNPNAVRGVLMSSPKLLNEQKEAITMRVQADHDVIIVSGARGKHLDPSVRARELPKGQLPTTAKLGIDATIPEGAPRSMYESLKPAFQDQVRLSDYLG